MSETFRKTVRKTMTEIIDETVDFYSKNPRSLYKAIGIYENSKCLYKGPSNSRCAFSRLIDDKYLDELEENASIENNWLRYLKPEYSGYNLGFYIDLQKLHDNDNNWEENGLTLKGKELVRQIKEIYSKY